jgi:hypothetical protein
MPGPRDYSSGTRAGLFALSRGTCYFPGCVEPAVKMLEGAPEIFVQIAHIRGAKPGSARYDETMSDAERADFSNVILLCTGHHNIVDKRNPDDYPRELLEDWKQDHERGTVIGGAPMTEDTLLSAMREIFVEMAPKRVLEVDLTAAIMTDEGPLGGGFEHVQVLREWNEHLRTKPILIGAVIRNIGLLSVSITEINLHFVTRRAQTQESTGEFTLQGRNDLPHLNAVLPARIQDGDALNWFWSSKTIVTVIAGAADSDVTFEGMYARVRLATGETVSSAVVTWAEVRDAGLIPD